jgi:hypothetical protein
VSKSSDVPADQKKETETKQEELKVELNKDQNQSPDNKTSDVPADQKKETETKQEEKDKSKTDKNTGK